MVFVMVALAKMATT
ncbi:hypothetical protein D043_5082A, partial [Vibrio parahaemolyticus EKP-021]